VAQLFSLGRLAMNRQKLSSVVIAALVVGLLVSLGLLAHEHHQEQRWKQQLQNFAVYYGSTRAKDDVQAGKFRLYVFAGARGKDEYSGTNDGPFQVWYSVYQPQDDTFRYAMEHVVGSYNASVRYMQEHPNSVTNRP